MSFILLLALACGPSGNAVRSASPSDEPTDTDTDTDTDADTDTAPAPETVAVSHDRELRGLYVATVYNIDWPSAAGLSAAAQQAEIVTLLDLAEAAGFNAVFVQMRPEGDALYASSIEPWSGVLTGRDGGDPGYDPLAVWVSEGHARGIEVHAWLNPYRARAGSEDTSGFPEGHMARDFATYAYPYGGDVWMDPGASLVRERVVAVVRDLVEHYDLDGIHFDDYFYPYPDDGDFPDDLTWAAYLGGGGTLARADWRRSNTRQLVSDVSAALADADASVRFGIAPFGIWRPGHPSGITGFDAYDGLFADPLDWARGGFLDYLAPQLYWETTDSGQEYELLVEWWDAELPDDVTLVPANALYKVGSSATWTLDEFAAQVGICRDPSYPSAQGNLWYNASAILDDASGVRAAFATRYYPSPAVPPAVHALAGTTEAPPTLSVAAGTVSWAPEAGRRVVTVYAEDGAGWSLHAIVPAEDGAVTLPAGRWALASVAKGGVESLGVVVSVP